MTVAVFGASGYGGQVLLRLLLDHPDVDRVLPVSSSAAGGPFDERIGGLGPDLDGRLPDDRRFLGRSDAEAARPDAVFSALPHGASADFCEPFFGRSVVFDLSADFRLRDAAAHQAAYGQPPPHPDVRPTAVYGLAEIHSDAVGTADIIAVPGCYPTCVLLPLIPLAAAGLITAPVTVNALTGISGAGRTARESSLYVERSENVVAYNPGRRHRHTAEMTQELAAAGSASPLFFTPHLVPMRRGMEATITMPVPSGRAADLGDRIGEILVRAYADQPFIGLRGGSIPSSRDVVGSNRCDIGWTVEQDGETAMLYLFSVIDNLVKGAAGQAVQDFNIRFGFALTAGLPVRAIA